MSNQQVDMKNLRKVVGSSVLGATIEWYDFFLYGVMAGLVFNQLFFPAVDGFIGTILSYATFTVGFIARPLGGIIFGHYGDKLGRKKVLMITLSLMGVSTVAIGLVPSYESIGVWAPILLTICRIVQGIGLGGEWGGSVLMSFEAAPEDKRSFYASLPQVGLSLGLLLAAGFTGVLSMSLSNEAFISWGWRITFISSAVLTIICYFIRNQVHESEEFTNKDAVKEEKEVETKVVATSKYPLVDAFKRYPRMMFACMGARFVEGISFNVFGVYSLTYLTQSQGMGREQSLLVVMLASLVMSFFIPFWGHIADRVGRIKIYGICALLLGLTSFPSFWLVHNFSDNFFVVCLAIGIPFGVIYSAVFGTMASLFSDSFDPSVRYSAISFIYQFTGIFASGMTPIVSTVLTGMLDGAPWYLCAYLLVMGLMSSGCALWINKMHNRKIA